MKKNGTEIQEYLEHDGKNYVRVEVNGFAQAGLDNIVHWFRVDDSDVRRWAGGITSDSLERLHDDMEPKRTLRDKLHDMVHNWSSGTTAHIWSMGGGYIGIRDGLSLKRVIELNVRDGRPVVYVANHEIDLDEIEVSE